MGHAWIKEKNKSNATEEILFHSKVPQKGKIKIKVG